jgi:hypothetical protein
MIVRHFGLGVGLPLFLQTLRSIFALSRNCTEPGAGGGFPGVFYTVADSDNAQVE